MAPQQPVQIRGTRRRGLEADIAVSVFWRPALASPEAGRQVTSPHSEDALCVGPSSVTGPGTLLPRRSPPVCLAVYLLGHAPSDGGQPPLSPCRPRSWLREQARTHLLIDGTNERPARCGPIRVCICSAGGPRGVSRDARCPPRAQDRGWQSRCKVSLQRCIMSDRRWAPRTRPWLRRRILSRA